MATQMFASKTFTNYIALIKVWITAVVYFQRYSLFCAFISILYFEICNPGIIGIGRQVVAWTIKSSSRERKSIVVRKK